MALFEPAWHRQPPDADALLLRFREGALLIPDQGLEAPEWPVEAQGQAESPPLLVGKLDGRNLYVVSESAGDEPAVPLWEVLSQASGPVVARVSTAIQLLHWQRDHAFCGRCGRPTQWLEAERARYCEACRHRYFPRLSPCVIVAIRHQGRVLLAQSHRARGRFHSLIAGFIEPGESAEEAVRREVKEETALDVTNLRYVESQSWPFPHQLMLGYIADYAGGELVPEVAELASAGWFGADALPQVPGEWTIAGRLIRLALRHDDEDGSR